MMDEIRVREKKHKNRRQKTDDGKLYGDLEGSGKGIQKLVQKYVMRM
jgi:hypothetical protein